MTKTLEDQLRHARERDTLLLEAHAQRRYGSELAKPGLPRELVRRRRPSLKVAAKPPGLPIGELAKMLTERPTQKKGARQ